MEEKSRAKDSLLNCPEHTLSHAEEHSLSSPLEKAPRRLKRDALRDKKKLKA